MDERRDSLLSHNNFDLETYLPDNTIYFYCPTLPSEISSTLNNCFYYWVIYQSFLSLFFFIFFFHLNYCLASKMLENGDKCNYPNSCPHLKSPFKGEQNVSMTTRKPCFSSSELSHTLTAHLLHYWSSLKREHVHISVNMVHDCSLERWHGCKCIHVWRGDQYVDNGVTQNGEWAQTDNGSWLSPLETEGSNGTCFLCT